MLLLLLGEAGRYTKFYGVDADAAAEQLAHDALLGELRDRTFVQKER